MRALVARFGRWLVSLSGESVSDATLQKLATTPLDVELATLVECACGRPWTDHACPQLTIDGEMARCACCGDILPQGTIRQHTGACVCAPCKGKIATGL